MTPLWWLVDRLSQTLDPDERDIVQGDFAESGATAGQALRDLLGLIARRQAALWKDWRPWLVLVGIGLAVVILRQLSHQLSGSFFRYVSIPWQFGVRYQTGLTLAEDITVFVSTAAALVGCAWASGLVLGSLSRQTIWSHGVLFSLVGTFPAWAIQLLAQHPWISVRLLVWNTTFLLAPGALGVRRIHRYGTLTVREATRSAVALLSLAALATWTGTWRRAAVVAWSEGAYRQTDTDWTRLLVYFVSLSWPTLYLLWAALSPRGRHGTVPH